jgi:hypothetical protein
VTIFNEAEHDFKLTHSGMNRTEWDAHVRRQNADAVAQARDEQALKPYTEGDPPKGRTLPAYLDWRDERRRKRDSMQDGRERLLKHTTAPAETERTLIEAGRALGRRMLVSVGLADAAQPQADTIEIDIEGIERRLEADKRSARAAQEALKIVDAEIVILDKQIAAVEARADEFFQPEIEDLAAPLCTAYVRKIGELREIVSLLFALETVSRKRFPAWDRKSFPRPPISVLNPVPDDRFRIVISDADKAYWKNARNTLLAGGSVTLPRRAS